MGSLGREIRRRLQQVALTRQHNDVFNHSAFAATLNCIGPSFVDVSDVRGVTLELEALA